MSLQRLGKKDSPPVLANGVVVTEAPVVRVNLEKVAPPEGFDLRRLAEIAADAKNKKNA